MTLQQVITKHISYDGDGGEKCPHCKKYIEAPHYWLDHRWTLAHEIAKFKGWPARFAESIEDMLEDIQVTGNPRIDAVTIARALEAQNDRRD